MTDILYTTTNGIRAALGVDDSEVADSQITDLGVLSILTLELHSNFPTHAALAAANAPGQTPTDEQKLQFMTLQLYCQYECAVQMLPHFQMLVAQKITDSDIETQRFQKDNLSDTIARITAQRDKYLGLLNPDAGLPAGTLAVAVLGIVVPTYDPVTNVGGDG